VGPQESNAENLFASVAERVLGRQSRRGARGVNSVHAITMRLSHDAHNVRLARSVLSVTGFELQSLLSWELQVTKDPITMEPNEKTLDARDAKKLFSAARDIIYDSASWLASSKAATFQASRCDTEHSQLNPLTL
jgi:hypothetical protein